MEIEKLPKNRWSLGVSGQGKVKREEEVEVDLDTELMVRFQKGDLEAYEELVRRYTSRVINLTFRYVQELHRAEDLAQEVFLRVFRARDSYTPRAKFSTWLYRIVVNLSLNTLRDSREEASLPPKEGIWAEGPESNGEKRIERGDSSDSLPSTSQPEDGGPIKQIRRDGSL